MTCDMRCGFKMKFMMFDIFGTNSLDMCKLCQL